MTAVSTPKIASALTMTLWKNEEPIGMCTLDDAGQLVVRANQKSQQMQLERWVRAKYRVQAGFAREEKRHFDAEQFLIGMPRYVRSLTISVSYPEEEDLPDPPHLTLPAFDSSKIPATPRRSLRRHR